MDEINDLLENYNSLVKERINLEVQLYQTKYPYENFILPYHIHLVLLKSLSKSQMI